METELSFWKDEKIEDIKTHESYIEKLNELIEQTKNCTKNEAILRVGFGSGWRFITGSWATNKEIMTDDDYDNFLYSVRNQKKYDNNVPFPKSRKISDEADIFGFVKLKME